VKIGIVGHAAEKFTPDTESAARLAIFDLISEFDRNGEMTIVSGRSPMGGIDIWAEEVAFQCDVATEIYAPVLDSRGRARWDGPGGFKERNIAIAEASDLVCVIVVRSYPPGYRGMRFRYCYHCRSRKPIVENHIKSGGCWTARKALSLGKEARWVVL
jgi:hypothetical protein